ncbi:GntR family transcriptional regulator [Scopulibacillus darangshiensis]|uniref:GntR family transcriptional regulator n=1 Tax=Scopulibacillus darangshiensis TaxID=442528 RepID=A0A4R2P9F1_9BACL|nr:GntR family transcriptional regulator [Scopulibacillus darangshiensis]TCP30968.1 GntR family transcriptional regulator [Scopulibacillus darangshiensis]
MVTQKGIALYSSLKEKLLNSIKNGTYKEGDQLPTESELSKKYQVSRTTVRLALQQLEIEGFILKKQGKGTFVTKPKIEENLSQGFQSFVEQMTHLGLEPYSKVLELTLIPADETVAEKLQLKEKEPVVKLVRLRYANKEPHSYIISFIPWSIAPGLINEDCSNSLYKVLTEKYKIQIGHDIETLEPILTDEEVSRFLNVTVGSPAFLLDAVIYSTANVPIEYAQDIIRGDRTKFTLKRHYQNNNLL